MGELDAGMTDVADALLLDAALENIPYGFCVWSPQFRLVMWNKNYREFYGFSEDAIKKGMTLEEVVHLSHKLGNHPGQSPDAFYESYTSELLSNRGGMRTKIDAGKIATGAGSGLWRPHRRDRPYLFGKTRLGGDA